MPQDQVECLWNLDAFPNSDVGSSEISRNDRYALDLLNKSKQQVNGHYQVQLLWKPGFPKLKSNFKQAMFRLEALRRRFVRDENEIVHRNHSRVRGQGLRGTRERPGFGR